MKPEEQFFEDKSNLEQALADFIELCKKIDRDVNEEVAEAVVNALRESGSKADCFIEGE